MIINNPVLKQEILVFLKSKLDLPEHIISLNLVINTDEPLKIENMDFYPSPKRNNNDS